MKQITLFFIVQVLEENLVFMFSKFLKTVMNGILWGKDTEGQSPRNSVRESVKYIILNFNSIKSMNKIITSLFLKKSIKAYHNSGRRPN